ncbi:MAG: chromosome partitioning protein ParB [Actinomycetes bacterium]
MRHEIEVSHIDRKYETHRQKSASREKQLLASIVMGGIQEPLSGVMLASGCAILLDGFKRLRCAEKTGLLIVPFLSLGEDEAGGIFQLLRTSNAKSLTLLEQAKWVDELKRMHGLSVAEIARRLERSQSWVCVRMNVLGEMSEKVALEIFSGRFPAYNFLYTLRQFRRLNAVPKSDIDEFVSAVSGKNLTTRDIDTLAGAYFRGGDQIRAQILQGDLGWCLSELKERARQQEAGQGDLSDLEKKCLRDFELLQGTMGRLGMRLISPHLKATNSFLAQADLLADGIISRTPQFLEVLRGFYDRIRQA